jgi:hypothetical protein
LSSAAAPPAPQLPDRILAKALTERLIEIVGLRNDVIAGHVDFSDVQTDIHTADVEGNVLNFAHQISFIRNLGRPFPCVPSGEGEPMPVSIFPDDPDWRNRPFSAEYSSSNYLLAIASKISYVSLSKATDFFQKRLEDFFTARFGGPRSDIAAGYGGSGLQFTVATITQGLRAHYSPAYFYDPTNVLNSPTSPVTGWIQPGRYIFGAGPSGSPPQFDFTAEYDVPPQKYASLGI